MKMKRQRGRPTKSAIRQKVVDLLNVVGTGYGYEISKIYNNVFTPVTQRSIYYHLRKGIETGEIALGEIKREKGSFSWGSIVEKKYYKLGEKAKPQDLPEGKSLLKNGKGVQQKWAKY
jgi:hypothetical protein